jgi:hypothetical protein
VADLIFVSIIIAFFALCIVYLKWCDRIIGPDEFVAVQDDDSAYVTVDAATDAAMVDVSDTEQVTA